MSFLKNMLIEESFQGRSSKVVKDISQKNVQVVSLTLEEAEKMLGRDLSELPSNEQEIALKFLRKIKQRRQHDKFLA